MPKFTTFFTVALLLFFFTLTNAARPTPATLPSNSIGKAQFEAETEVTEMDDQSCEGLGKEDCLERSLAAHLDYIYTQGQKHHEP